MALMGKNGVLKIGEAGGEPSTEVKRVKDVTINTSKNMADVSTRASGGWRENAPGLKEGTIEFTMVAVDATSSDYAAQKKILDAYDTDTPLSVFADNGKGKGIKGDFYVTDASESQPLEDAITYSVTLSPCCDTRVPTITR